MSFSGEVKEEIKGHMEPARHCQIAELSAYIRFCAKQSVNEQGEKVLEFSSENELVVRKCFTLLRKAFNIYTDVLSPEMRVNSVGGYRLLVRQEQRLDDVLAATLSPMALRSLCCKRAFLRGAYLAVGSMADPQKSYHLEYVCQEAEQAELIQGCLVACDISAKVILRRKYYVVYVKEGSEIVELLNHIGAHISLMNMENYRILKEIGNSINRRVNCEAANMSKAIVTATKQKDDILYIQENGGLDQLPTHLQEVALVRLALPEEVTLKEIGEQLNPPLGKSGVNHRLRKITNIAEEIRGSKVPTDCQL